MYIIMMVKLYCQTLVNQPSISAEDKGEFFDMI